MRAFDKTYLASLGFADKDKENSLHSLGCQYLCRPEVTIALYEALGLRSSSMPIALMSKAAVSEQDILTHAKPSEELSGPTRMNAPIYQDSEMFENVRTYSVAHGVQVKAGQEVGIHKGENQYRVTIGFWDVVLIFSTRITCRYDAKGIKYLRPVKPPSSGLFAKANFAPLPTYADCSREVSPDWGVPRFQSREYDDCSVRIEVKANPVDVSEIARQMELYLTYTPKCRDKDVFAVAVTWDFHADERALLEAKGIKIIRLGQAFEHYCNTRREEKGKAQADVTI